MSSVAPEKSPPEVFKSALRLKTTTSSWTPELCLKQDSKGSLFLIKFNTKGHWCFRMLCIVMLLAVQLILHLFCWTNGESLYLWWLFNLYFPIFFKTVLNLDFFFLVWHSLTVTQGHKDTSAGVVPREGCLFLTVPTRILSDELNWQPSSHPDLPLPPAHYIMSLSFRHLSAAVIRVHSNKQLHQNLLLFQRNLGVSLGSVWSLHMVFLPAARFK